MTEPLLATSALRKSYGRRTVIDGLDLCVPEGSVYGFLGRNGAGKTTTLRMLLGILRPNSGTITYDGTTVRRVNQRLKRKIGYVSQQQHFYGWMRCERLGRFVGAFYPTWDHAHFQTLLETLQVERKQRVRELSGGTRMKLAIALALAHHPKLLILDEPTAGVDPIARREILDTLRHQAREQGRTVLFSTHHISEVDDIADQVGLLHDGRVFWQGRPDDLREEVRRVRGPAPAGATVLSEKDGVTIAQAPPEVWRACVPEPERATVEEAFIAVAGMGVL